MIFPGLTHIALTVTDLPTSVDWYRQLLGSEPVLNEDTGSFHHAVFALDGGTLLGLHAHPSGAAASGDRFDERRVGLDHVAFGCADRAELEKWQQHLDTLGIRHGGIIDAHYGSGLSFRDLDNTALEFFAPPTPR
ncbi:VOC family protein [Streptomyces sp. NPDC005479]|uniref:VOC family protein n=1 Tax=Streptomyces sp. NPDC005479 TaxID=3154879 RepID=UPI0033B5F56C